MNIKFDGSKDGNKEIFEIRKADFGHMLKMRKEKFPELSSGIQDALKDYDGGTFALIVMEEDENGLPHSRQLVLGGVSRPEVHVALASELRKAADHLQDSMIEQASGNPEMLLKLAQIFTEQLTEEIKQFNKEK